MAPIDALQGSFTQAAFCTRVSPAGITGHEGAADRLLAAALRRLAGTVLLGGLSQKRGGAAELRSPGAGWVLLAGLCQSVEHLAQVLVEPEMPLALMHDEACVGQLL